MRTAVWLLTKSSDTTFFKSFCKSQFPHKYVNFFFILVTVKDKLTDLWGSGILQFVFTNALFEIKEEGAP